MQIKIAIKYGVQTYADENGDRKLVPIQDDGPPAKKRRKVGA